MTVDYQGNIYVSDEMLNQILKIDLQGMLHVVAGNGQQGFSVDGSLARTAKLNVPASLVVDDLGHIYFIEEGSNLIRKIEGPDQTPPVGGVKMNQGMTSSNVGRFSCSCFVKMRRRAANMFGCHMMG